MQHVYWQIDHKNKNAEILEEKIRDLLRNCSLEATIDDSITGNMTITTDCDDEYYTRILAQPFFSYHIWAIALFL